MRMRRVVVVLVLLAAAAVGRSVSVSTAADPAVVGQWSAVINWPAVGVHSHLLNTGRVLTWQTGSQATVFDPATGAFNALPNPWADLLCSGHAFLPDGRLVSIGGWDRSDRKSTRLNSSHRCISYAGFCLKKKIKNASNFAR